jgi:hypothetical protein
MKLIRTGTGYMAVQAATGSRGPVNVAGYGNTTLKAMEACTGLLATMGTPCA